jgi:hypothetical protein
MYELDQIGRQVMTIDNGQLRFRNMQNSGAVKELTIPTFHICNLPV